MSRLEKALLGALALVVVAAFWAGPDTSQRNVEFLPDMVRSPAAESYDACEVFADGRTLQTPPAGTVARGFAPLVANGLVLDTRTPWEELTPEQVAAWNALRGPEADAAALERGRAVFAAFCTPCHGASGAGDGPVTKRGVPPPANLLAEANQALSDGRMFRAITCGKGNMAAHAAQVGREDRWKVIRYVRTLQGK